MFYAFYRAVNNGLLDTYQLKSLDAVLEASVEEMKLTKQTNGKLRVKIREPNDTDEQNIDMFDNFALRDDYDRVIQCLGFTFDDTIFAK